MPKCCIIGAGISGLAIAWQLERQGNECTVLESSGQVGGAMQSYREGDYLAEAGPNSLLINKPEIEEFILNIPNLSERVVEASSDAQKRFIIRNGELQAVPQGPLSAVTTPLWSFKGKLRVLKEPFIKRRATDDEESVADFVTRRLGDELYQYAINPLVGGIYAGDPRKLSIRYAFPKVYALEKNYGGMIRGAIALMRQARTSKKPKTRKRIISFKNGMGELPHALANALAGDLQRGTSIQSIEQKDQMWRLTWTQDNESQQTEDFDRLIVTVPAHKLSQLPFESEILESFSSFSNIEYPALSVLSIAYKRSDIGHRLDGFGALVPECEQRKILGVLFNSSLFKGRAPEDEALLTVFVGGARQPGLASDSLEDLKSIVQPELEALLNIQGKPTFTHHRFWGQAIPQYKMGYGAKLDAMQAIESKFPGLKIAGNYRSGISVNYCIEAALAYQ